METDKQEKDKDSSPSKNEDSDKNKYNDTPRADPSARPPPGEAHGALRCVGVLPGLGHYCNNRSSDSDDSSDFNCDLLTNVTSRNRDGSGASDGDGKRQEFRTHHLQRLVSRRCCHGDKATGSSPAAAEFTKDQPMVCKEGPPRTKPRTNQRGEK